jgi:hypothetical protein
MAMAAGVLLIRIGVPRIVTSILVVATVTLSIKFGRPSIPTVKVDKAKRELATGKGVRQVARMEHEKIASLPPIWYKGEVLMQSVVTRKARHE